jgi:putative transposase
VLIRYPSIYEKTVLDRSFGRRMGTCLEEHLPSPENEGRPRVHGLREILNAIFYVEKSGCAWRLLPHEFPPWKTVYHYFRFWRLDGTWERMHRALRERVRVRLKRNPQPSAGVVDRASRSKQPG